MNCEHLRKRWALYAADELDWHERVVLEEHLAGGCGECEAELLAARGAMAGLWLSLEPGVPSAHVKQRLMAKVAWADDAFEMAAARRKAKVRLWAGVPAAAACAAAVAVAVMIGGQGGATPSVQPSPSTVVGQVALRDALPVQVAGSDRVAVSTPQDVNKIDTMVIPLAGTGTSAGLSGRLIWDRTNHVCHVLVPGLMRTSPGKAYRLWFLTTDGQVVMTRAFAVTSDTHGDVTVTLPSRLRSDSTAIARATITYGPATQTTPGIALLVGQLHK